MMATTRDPDQERAPDQRRPATRRPAQGEQVAAPAGDREHDDEEDGVDERRADRGRVLVEHVRSGVPLETRPAYSTAIDSTSAPTDQPTVAATRAVAGAWQAPEATPKMTDRAVARTVHSRRG